MAKAPSDGESVRWSFKIIRDTPRAGPEGPACLKSHKKV